MTTSRTLVAIAFACAAAPFGVRAQVLGDVPSAIPSLELGILNTFPPPADDLLLDSSGSVVMDSSGHPASDPDERFHQVKPFQFDPDHTWLVQAAWLNGIGCPNAECGDVDPTDQHNEGLLLAKTGSTEKNAAAIAELKKVRGITGAGLVLGYDIRKSGSSGNPAGSHCGAGAPRFDVITTDGTTHFIGCNSPPGAPTVQGTGWVRLRWTDPTAAFPPITPSEVVSRIFIVFDEGTDPAGGPDMFGAAILDNIFLNGQYVGAGATDAR